MTAETGAKHQNDLPKCSRKTSEWLVFCFLTIVFWPALTLAVIGGLGLVLWIAGTVSGPTQPFGIDL